MGTLCAGCLAADRILWTLHKEVYKLGLDLFQSFRQKPTTQRKHKQEIKLCWECQNMIGNIHKFQQKVKKAQEVLTKKKIDTTQVKCLSTLSAVTHVDNFDYIFYECPEDTVKLENRKYLNDDDFTAYEDETENLSDYEEIEIKEHLIDDLKEVLFNNDEQQIQCSVENLETSGNSENILNHNFKKDGDQLKNEKYVAKYTDDFKQEFEMQAPSPNSANGNKSDKVSGTKQAGKDISSKGTRKGLKKGTILGPAKKGAQGSYEIVTIANIPQPIDGRPSFLGSQYKAIVIDQKEVKELKSSCIKVRVKRFGCECGSHFSTESTLQKHIRKFHLKQSGKYICDICDKRMKTLPKMAIHLREHFLKFQCLICQKICFPRTRLFAHLKTHTRVLRCIICKLTFGHRQDFNKHYKEQHARLFCDVCGFNTAKKDTLEKHITKKHMTMTHKCKECNREFVMQSSLGRHILKYHTISAPEESYCVECDIQFQNKTQLRDHFRNSNRHDRKSSKTIPCPKCDNFYTRTKFMQNHYNYVHLKRTKYNCEQCAMFFLTSTHLSRHMLKHGIGELKKNKFCPHCGRGFSAKAILTKHIRTHTGERPYECNFCPAAFAQSSARNTHMKKLHNWFRGASVQIATYVPNIPI